MAQEIEDIQLNFRVNRTLYEKILERQKEAKKLTGIEPTVSAVARVMLEESAGRKR